MTIGALGETLGRADFLRWDFERPPDPELSPRKEWHHYLLHAPGLHLVVNFSLSDDPWNPGAPAARVIVLARTAAGWCGGMDRHDDVTASTDRNRLAIGPHRMELRGESYLVAATDPDGHVEADLVFRPASTPFFFNHHRLSGESTLAWLFVPQLTVSGRVRVGEDAFELDGQPAYHDHNWGELLWGGDFSWEWASGLSRRGDDELAVVFSRTGDRDRTVARSQVLGIWRGGQPIAHLRDAEIEVTTGGLIDTGAGLTVPPVMSLLSSPFASDIPRRLELVVRSGPLRVVFELADHARFVLPDDVALDRVLHVNEAVGTITVEGAIDGRTIQMEGDGVVEFLRA